MEERPIQVAPELEPVIVEILGQYEGEDRKKAERAVVAVIRSSFTGSFTQLAAKLREAAEGAVA
jgi:hypothetical protein